MPALPIVARVAASPSARGGAATPVVDQAFVDEQLANALSLFGTFGVSFTLESAAALDPKFLALETRSDRDALAAELETSVVNVFFVESLRDVDEPSRYRMGVTWRKLTSLGKKYVIVSSAARPTTMAHELGHFFGLDHTSVKNNLMSYDRDGGTVFLDPTQGRTIRRHAEALYRTGALVPREGAPVGR